MLLMRGAVVFLFLLSFFTDTIAYSQEPDHQYFLKPSVQDSSNNLTKFFRSRSAIMYDAHPCHDRFFYSHLATPAQTLTGGRMAYEPFPGARFDGLLLNSLSMGLWRGIQVGVVPILYLIGDQPQQGNESGVSSLSSFNLKWTMFSFKKMDIAMAWSFMDWDSHFATPMIVPSGSVSTAEIGLTWTTLVVNYYFENLPLALGINWSSVYLHSTNLELDKILREQNTNSESILDLNYILNSNWAFTLGTGRIKETAFELEKAYYGYGGTVTYIRNKHWFNQISIGYHHFNDIKADKLLFSFSI